MSHSASASHCTPKYRGQWQQRHKGSCCQLEQSWGYDCTKTIQFSFGLLVSQNSVQVEVAMTAELPSTPAASTKSADMHITSYRPLTPQQGPTPGITPISKAIALLQHRSSATPNALQGRTQRTAELSARKAELATLLNQVINC